MDRKIKDFSLTTKTFQSDIESALQASKKGDLKKLKELAGKNSKLIFSRDSSGRSPLHLAGLGGHIEVVKFILGEDAETTKLLDNVMSKNLLLKL